MYITEPGTAQVASAGATRPGEPFDIETVKADFIDAMRSAGVAIESGGDHPIADGKWHRADAIGKKKKRNQHVRYFLHTDGVPAGFFCDVQTGVEDSWCAKKPNTMTKEERDGLRKATEAAKRLRAEERAKEVETAQANAAELMKATAKATPDHGYLTKKGIPVFPGLRVLPKSAKYTPYGEEEPKTVAAGSLVIGAYSSASVLMGLQFIRPDGGKLFMKGMAKEASYHPIGKPPAEEDGVILISEGYATAARLHLATGHLSIAAWDSGNLPAVATAIREKYPRSRIMLCADNDRMTVKPVENPGLTKAREAAEKVKARVCFPTFAEGDIVSTDFDDLAQISGLPAVAAIVEAALNPQRDKAHTPEASRPASYPIVSFERPGPGDIRKLSVAGYHLESASPSHLASVILSILKRNFEEVVYDEGGLWVWHKSVWVRADEKRDLGPLIQALDGQPAGKRTVTMGPRLRRDIIEEMEVALVGEQDEPAFFSNAPAGIPCRNGFVSIENGVAVRKDHSPAHRQRWLLNADCNPDLPPFPAPGTLLHRLLQGAFADDADIDDKIALIGEIFGAAVSGQATSIAQPLAFFLIGETAQNGKSQILACLRALLASTSVCAISPKLFADEKHLVRLVGACANVVDEVDGRTIDGAEFKRAVLGERMMARDVYKAAIEFEPGAIHVFSANALPEFTTGFDRGIRRRVMPVTFNRTIPRAEQVPHIAERIIAEEASQLLSFAVAGAIRLQSNGRYTCPASSAERLVEWGRADPITEWAALAILPCNKKPAAGWPQRRDAYEAFREWANEEGFSTNKLPSPDDFWRKLKAVPTIRTARVNGMATLYAEIRR